MYIYLESSNFSQDFFPFEIQFGAINSIDIISLLLFETRERKKYTSPILISHRERSDDLIDAIYLLSNSSINLILSVHSIISLDSQNPRKIHDPCKLRLIASNFSFSINTVTRLYSRTSTSLSFLFIAINL